VVGARIEVKAVILDDQRTLGESYRLDEISANRQIEVKELGRWCQSLPQIAALRTKDAANVFLAARAADERSSDSAAARVRDEITTMIRQASESSDPEITQAVKQLLEVRCAIAQEYRPQRLGTGKP
jgi:hypothetical protein